MPGFQLDTYYLSTTWQLQGLIMIGDGLQYISTLQNLKTEWQNAGSPEADLIRFV